MNLHFFTSENRELLLKTLKLRHKGFIQEENYDTFECDGMEFDQYDTPFTDYVACVVNNEVIACGRLSRTDIPYATKDVWARQIPKEHLPKHKDIYEFTRLYVDSAVKPFTTRNKIVRIMSSYTYLCLAKMNAKEFYFVTYKSVFNSCAKLGFDAEILCDIEIEGYENIKYCRAIVEKSNVGAVENIMNEIIKSVDLEICS